jgi:hypothetical protein
LPHLHSFLRFLSPPLGDLGGILGNKVIIFITI